MAELRERRRDRTRLRQPSGGSQMEVQKPSTDVFRGCRPWLSNTITMPLIFSGFPTKARAFQGKFGHLKGVLFSSSYFSSPNIFLNGFKVHFCKGCDALNVFLCSVTGRQGGDHRLMFHGISLEHFISFPIMDMLPLLFWMLGKCDGVQH